MLSRNILMAALASALRERGMQPGFHGPSLAHMIPTAIRQQNLKEAGRCSVPAIFTQSKDRNSNCFLNTHMVPNPLFTRGLAAGTFSLNEIGLIIWEDI